ncbi:MAG: DUF2946 family protein [Alphaproteobacteria bacterium]
MMARNAHGLRGWRRFAARFGLAGLLLQGLLPLLAFGLAPSAPALAWDQVVLCTADGPKSVSLSELAGDLPPASEQAPHLPYCPACPGYAQAHAAITPPAVLAAAPGRVEILSVAFIDEREPDARRHSPQSARAPPSFA